MHPLHEHVAQRLAEQLRKRKVVVWYDVRRELAPFVAELRGAAPAAAGTAISVTVAGVGAQLAEYDGSFLAVRAAVEPHVGGDEPDPVFVYVGGVERDKHNSLLMELEEGGTTVAARLRTYARDVLRQRYTDGAIDELLASEQLTYEDLARAASDDAAGEPPSLLKSIFHDATGGDALLAAWLASDADDAEVEAKGACGELAKLARSRLGLELPADAPLAKLRAIALRYVLAGEFRADLRCPPPASLDAVPAPGTRKAEDAVRALARRLREHRADAYAAAADRVEAELGLGTAALAADALGSIDTFRFEERALLAHCAALVAGGRFGEARAVAVEREHSFWLDRDVARKAQWEACRRMAELGEAAAAVRGSVAARPGDAGAWIAAYTAEGGWHRMDRAQRRLESWTATLDDEPDERALGVVRRLYDEACHAMAEGFAGALERARWTAPGPPQTEVYRDVVAGRAGPAAYFLVDALRFEMGRELAERLPGDAEVSVRHAVAALPSITPVGMAALQPGAAASFDVVAQGARLGVRIDDAFLPDRAARARFAAARIPHLVDLSLDELLSLQPSKLTKQLDGARMVVVRSQEIDRVGEAGLTFPARQVMDTVIDNLVRAVKKLAAAGVEQAVVAADHGHLFFPADRDESMRIDAPGGHEVELHRRCWIGRGGTTPPGCVRIAASELGYASDLDFVFPRGTGVFRAGGDLAYYHGGLSLQEIVVPVLTVRLKARAGALRAATPVVASGLPEAVTNRIFTVSLRLGGADLALFADATPVRPLLVSAGREVGAAGMVVDGDLDRDAGTVVLQPGKPVTVAFLLRDESVASLRVVVQDPGTDAELYRSPADIPVRLGV